MYSSFCLWSYFRIHIALVVITMSLELKSRIKILTLLRVFNISCSEAFFFMDVSPFSFLKLILKRFLMHDLLDDLPLGCLISFVSSFKGFPSFTSSIFSIFSWITFFSDVGTSLTDTDSLDLILSFDSSFFSSSFYSD